MISNCVWRLTVSSALSLVLGTALVVAPMSVAQAQSSGGGDAAAQPVRVVAAPVEERSIAGSIDLVGQISAINRVDVRARVEGFLQDVVFAEGTLIKAGDTLYEIEPDQFEAAVTQAQGALDRAQAQETLAKTQLDRSQQLLDDQVDSVARRDQRKAEFDSATADVLTSKGQLQDAQIKLGYTTITAPIDGRIGRTAITKGNLVGPSSGVLTTIVSQDPIYAVFQISEVAFRQLRNSAEADPDKVKVRLTFSDGTDYDQVGSIDFIDAIVNQNTDTVLVRANFANADGVLRDGQLVRVKLESGDPQMRTLVAQSAIIADQGGLYVFVVKDGKAVQQTIEIGKPQGADVVVTKGLAKGDMVIVDGLERVRPGVPVVAQPAEKSDTGSATSTEPSPDAAPASGDTPPASDDTSASGDKG